MNFIPPFTDNPALNEWMTSVSRYVSDIKPGDTYKTDGTIVTPGGNVSGYQKRYIHVKYANNKEGSNFTNSQTNRFFYGIYNSDSSSESTLWYDYTWYPVDPLNSTIGFSTNKFLYYKILGGRQVNFQVGTAAPDASWSAVPAGAIDLETLVSEGSIANAQLANMTPPSIKGRVTVGDGPPEDLTPTQVTGMLNTFATDTKGLVPGPSAAEVSALKVLRANGTWGVGGSEFYYQNTTPTANAIGARWVHSDTGAEYVWIYDGDNYLWFQVYSPGGGSEAIVPSIDSLYKSYEQCLLHFDSNYANSIAGGPAFSLSGTGVSISSAQSKFGGSSLLHAGTTTGCLVSTDIAPFQIGYDDFTFECWVYVTGGSGERTVIGEWETGTSNWLFGINNAREVRFYINNTFAHYTAGYAVPLNTWTHIAVSRNGSTLRLFIDGIPRYVSGTIFTFTTTTRAIIGAQTITGYVGPWTGYIDELRMHRGFSRYNGKFTPRTTAFD